MVWQHGRLFVSLESWNLKALTSTQSLLSCITFEICSDFKFSLIFFCHYFCYHLLRTKHFSRWIQGFIIPLLKDYYFPFLYLYFSLRNTSYSLICASHRSHNEFARDENNMNKTVQMFFATNQKSVVFKVQLISTEYLYRLQNPEFS